MKFSLKILLSAIADAVCFSVIIYFVNLGMYKFKYLQVVSWKYYLIIMAASFIASFLYRLFAKKKIELQRKDLKQKANEFVEKM